uniref:Protein FAM83H-like n=1 Tax=Takifugu rubripes TaxID=31033 RepID=A0A3B5KJ63_TAKRU
MARHSQCSSAGDNPLNPNYLPPHYREEYRLAIDALIEDDLEGYYHFLQKADVVDFLSPPEIQYIQESVQLPQEIGNEQRYVETNGDGSSDTYWPIHSDLDAPGLDLGWPQLHSFIGPTEITTLVNPPEPDMPSIKEQARRLIKNAQQVIAIVMDMFTDVDILHDILTAAMRNVAVYILLDEQNTHHFVNMVSNCRVNLQSFQFVRVRTVSGITYHCRSGKSFKGQMMDRFLLTDCRAVLSGNYSFMWSFEKIHRCMAHLFLGQLVSTFDEEFRILFAQSEPLIIENTFMPMEEFSLTQSRQYPSERPSLYKDSRNFLSPEFAHSEEWGRHSYDERVDVDWRLMPKRKEILQSPADIYSRFPSQQMRMDPSFEQSPSRMPLAENPTFKRHSYAEGGRGRYPFLSMPEPETQGRQFHRHPYLGPGKESEYNAYDKFWNQDFQLADQHADPTLAHEMEPPDNFEPVLNYLSSVRNVEYDQSSDKLSAEAVDLPFSSAYPKRLCSGQPYACQKSPAPSKSAEQKAFFPEPNPARKDPSVKRGLRDWRISSYLSAYDSKGDEGLPLEPPNVSDPFEDSTKVLPPITSRIDFSTPKIPNVREFKVPAMPRASQIPGYAKTATRELPRKLTDDLSSSVVEETKATPSPSESSSTTEGERMEEAEQKEHITSLPNREDSFRRKYNAAIPRCSRLRSSLIFSSLDQQHAQDAKSTPGQNEEESEKTESEPTKQSLISHLLGQRKTTAREPFEWSRYINKSATFDSATDSSKPEKSEADRQTPSNDENTKDPSENNEESLKPLNAGQIEQTTSSPSVSKPANPECPDKHTKPKKSLLSASTYVDMNDPDARLMFFKELAAKRKAAKAEKSQELIQVDQPTVIKTIPSVKKETSDPEDLTETATPYRICTKSDEDEKIIEEISIKQPMELNNTSSGKQESGPEEAASTVTAKDKLSSEKHSVKYPTKQESALRETTDQMSATAESTETPKEKESKGNSSVKQPMDKHSFSVKQEDLDPNEPIEKIREAVTPIETMKEETLNKPPTDEKTSISLTTEINHNEPAEKMAASVLSMKTPKDECKEVSVKPLKTETNVLIKNQEFTTEETTEKQAATTTSTKLAGEKKGKVSITQPVGIKSDTRTEKEEPFPKETLDETALVTMAVYVKPSANLQNISLVKEEDSGREEMSRQRASPGGAARGAEAEKGKEKVPSKQTVELEPEICAKKEQSDARDMAETFAAASLPTKPAEAEKTKEKVQMTQPTELMSVKNEEQDPKGKAGRIPAEVSERNSESKNTEPAALPPLLPENSESEISSTISSMVTSALRSLSNSVDSDSHIDVGHLPVGSSLHCTPTETVSSNLVPEISEHSVNSSLQAVEEECIGQTEQEPVPACQDSASQLTSPETPSADDSEHAPSELCLEGFTGDSELHTSSPESVESLDPAHLDETLPKSENSLLLHVTEERYENLEITLQVRADGTPPSPNPPETDQNEFTVTFPSTPNPKSEDFPEETQSHASPDSPTNASQSDITDPRISALPSSEANLTGPVPLSHSETASCLAPCDSAEPVLSPEGKETPSALHSPSHNPSLSDQISTDLKKSPSTDLHSPTESTSNVPPVSDLTCKLPKAVISEHQSPEPQVPAQNSKESSQTEVSHGREMPETVEEKDETTDTTNNSSIAQESADSERTNDQVGKKNYSEPQEVTPDDVIPPSPQSKLPQSSQSRYQSSTANVISSSNLRDDTKLLLGQISAHSQSRNEVSKDAAVTDDEKEDKADKNAKRKETAFRSFVRGQPNSNQERDKLLERIQSMRKERKVYSRFEMAS